MTKVKKDTVVRRLYARGTWKLDSVAHFGSEIGSAEMSLLRDDKGKPFIPAASIAGTARSFLARQREPWVKYRKGVEDKAIKRFFGGDMRLDRSPEKKDKDTMSALIVADADCLSEQVETSIRDGVRVDHSSGSAATGAKFDVEVVERGTEFALNLECIIRCENEQPGMKDGNEQPNLEDLFLALLHAFKTADIHLGARTRRGYGRGKVDAWDIRDLRMKNPEDVIAWLRDDPWSRPVPDNLCPRPLLSTDKRESLYIEADFELQTSLLIRSSSGDPKAPDMVHLQSVGEPVVPGTSFAGAFRHRAALIADILGWKPRKTPDYEDADAVCDMFGPIHKQSQSTNQQNVLWASRIWVEEHLVENVELQWRDRVAINRFTGGSLDGALFSQKPAYPLSFKDLEVKQPRTNLRLRLTLENPDWTEIGLLFLTLRDFWYGHAALGGETSNGRGTLRGIKAQLKFKRSGVSNVEVWKFSRGEDKCKITLDEGDKTFLESCVRAAQGYSNCPTGSRRPKDKGEEESNVK